MSSDIKLRCLDDIGNNYFVVNSISGVSSFNTQHSSNASSGGFVIYSGLGIANTTNSNSSTQGGALTIAGGASFGKDLYIGGDLYVGNQKILNVSGVVTVGSYLGTSGYTINNIAIGQTMSNTNYKLFGTLSTTTNNNNAYIVSFKNLTTTTFDAVIYRIDALGSGWSDANLKLVWQIL